LRKAVQVLVQHTGPLGTCMDYVQEDVGFMTAELHRWEEECQKYDAAGIMVQAMPAGCHGQNPAERQVRTWKGHFITALAIADPEFSFVQSAHLVPQAKWSLNML
jgi:hypothetical protein